MSSRSESRSSREGLHDTVASRGELTVEVEPFSSHRIQGEDVVVTDAPCEIPDRSSASSNSERESWVEDLAGDLRASMPFSQFEREDADEEMVDGDAGDPCV